MVSTPHEATSVPSQPAPSVTPANGTPVNAEIPVNINAPDPITIDNFTDVCRLESLAQYDPGIKSPLVGHQ